MKIGIVIPAHNEALTIAGCLASVQAAMAQLPKGVSASPLVVLDNCTDNTEAIVKALKVDYLSCDYQCVGRVRDFGLRHVIDDGATWLCCTDADSTVSKDWLAQQISHLLQPTDMICGVVSIADWSNLTPKTREDYLAHYQDKMGHRHIHGANLSFSSRAYLVAGGFEAMPCHEDVNLVKKFETQGFNIIWSNLVRVTTSSRLQARAAEGFAAFLANLEQNH
ncbi:glycosyltransferase [Psychrobacter ciconiae]|uniref:glycosyltransferase n=1 Tax=Psychrobacter ciconiae TaxID=1553449 RepID=UPI00191A5854|nr:glycosyltransferase family A protein [Psychrobacter ciconiae]